MKTILDIAVAASGSPSEVKARIADQVSAAAGSQELAGIVGAVRAFVDRKLEGVSEDDTLAVSAEIKAIIKEAPAIVAAKQEAERAASKTKIGELEASLDALTKQLGDTKAELETAKAALPVIPAGGPITPVTTS